MVKLPLKFDILGEHLSFKFDFLEDQLHVGFNDLVRIIDGENDPNLIPENIKKGVTICNVVGTLEAVGIINVYIEEVAQHGG